MSYTDIFTNAFKTADTAGSQSRSSSALAGGSGFGVAGISNARYSSFAGDNNEVTPHHREPPRVALSSVPRVCSAVSPLRIQSAYTPEGVARAPNVAATPQASERRSQLNVSSPYAAPSVLESLRQAQSPARAARGSPPRDVSMTSPRQNKSSLLSYQRSREKLRELSEREAVQRNRDVGIHTDPVGVLSSSITATPKSGVAVSARRHAPAPFSSSLLKETESIAAKYGGVASAPDTQKQGTPSRAKPQFRVSGSGASAAADALSDPPPPVRPQTEAIATQVREALHRLTGTMAALNSRLVELTETQWELQLTADRLRAEIRDASEERDEITAKLNHMCSSMGQGLSAMIAEAEEKQQWLNAAREENARLRHSLRL